MYAIDIYNAQLIGVWLTYMLYSRALHIRIHSLKCIFIYVCLSICSYIRGWTLIVEYVQEFSASVQFITFVKLCEIVSLSCVTVNFSQLSVEMIESLLGTSEFLLEVELMHSVHQLRGFDWVYG